MTRPGSSRTRDLQQLLKRIEENAVSGETVSVREIMEAVGSRSFGPLLLLAGLFTLAPLIGDIPGVPTLIGTTVLLVAAQLLWGRDQFWLPNWLLDRSVSTKKLGKALDWARKPARFIDRFVNPRLTWLIEGPMVRVIAVLCMLIAIAMPPMELIPFSANAAGAALAAFGLAIISRDGALAIVAFLFTAGTGGIVLANLI